jgi:hypothetical protein
MEEAAAELVMAISGEMRDEKRVAGDKAASSVP